ncbi:MAG: peptidylprolyl isomerase [Bacteroidetes Order II. Incertae sedis bacterium]|nr:peptidylprolyl isomerase [Bacteroidetes Order II. bacterium]
MLYRFIALFLLIGLASGCKQEKYPKADQDESDQYFRQSGDFAGSHILVSYKGAERATATRAKEEARKTANAILNALKTDPSKFEEFAQKNSDDKNAAARKGDLGSWPVGAMVPDFELAVRQTGIGKIHPKVVETPFGFHIIRRNSLRTKFVGGTAILLGYKTPETPQFTRSKAAAEARAAEIKKQLNAANFDALATKFNDFEKKATYWKPFTRLDQNNSEEIMPLFESLKYGEVGGPIDLKGVIGFFKRDKMVLVTAAHLLVSWKGATPVPATGANPTIRTVSRSKEEARALVNQLVTQLRQNPNQFETLVSTSSDDVITMKTGGQLGTWFLGGGLPAFDEVIKKVPEGQVFATPIETEYGFHILRRMKVPEMAFKD